MHLTVQFAAVKLVIYSANAGWNVTADGTMSMKESVTIGVLRASPAHTLKK